MPELPLVGPAYGVPAYFWSGCACGRGVNCDTIRWVDVSVVGLLGTAKLAMSDYRRWFVAGGTYFFTLVTYNRRPILTTPLGRRALRAAIESVRPARPFDLLATVLLPDHWHLVMRLPNGDSNFPLRMHQIKAKFTELWLADGGIESAVTESQQRRGERGVWQSRYWEHSVRDEDDLESCVDYLHWNPCKHGLVSRVRDWPWSSFHRFVRQGHYAADWGGVAPPALPQHRDWGE